MIMINYKKIRNARLLALLTIVMCFSMSCEKHILNKNELNNVSSG